MGQRTCANPPVTRESTDTAVPDLLGVNSSSEDDELPPPFNPLEAGVNPEASSTPADGEERVATSTPTNRSGSTKRKLPTKSMYFFGGVGSLSALLTIV